MKEPKIGVVTVTFNSEKVLPDFIQSCKLQSYKNYVLYVVDNDSHDNSIQYLEENQDGLSVCLVKNAENYGVAKANNQGVLKAIEDECDFVLLINNDVVFGASLFSDLLSGLRKHDAGAVFPKMYYHDNPRKIWCAGGTFLENRGMAALHYGIGCIDNGEYDLDRVIEYSPTCCVLLKADVFEKIGLFDEKYFVYYDDTDFFYRAKLNDIRVYYLGNTSLFHKVSSLTGGGGVSKFSLRYMTRNRVYFIRKLIDGRVGPVFWLLFLQAQMLRDFLVKKVDYQGYMIMQRAFFEGCSIELDEK